jgi:hypothetical protein
MKRYLYFLLITCLSFSACDYVSNPYPEANANIGDTLACPTPTFPVLSTHVKKILIEDYTGHTCPNCPRAARELHDIDSIHPGRIVALAIHVGGLAAPSSGHGGTPAGSFSADYRTSVGNQYDAVFGADAFGLPQGLFNRKDFDATTQTHLKFYPNWDSYLSTIISEPSVADLQIINSFNDTTGQLCTAIKSTFLTNLPGTYKLAVLLVQDSIVSWQDDIDNGMVEFYVHRHMLRDAITPSGPWGDTLSSSVNAGDAVIKRYAYVIPPQYGGVPVQVEHCHVVAFIYNTTTYEVIQSEDAKVKP